MLECVFLKMYKSFYNLTADPFDLHPDPEFCFKHQGYNQARALVEYALGRSEGLIVVTGERGVGKTMLIYELVAAMPSQQWLLSILSSAPWNNGELLRLVCSNFGLKEDADRPSAATFLLEKLLTEQTHAGKRVLLILDEAQHLSMTALNDIRALTNLQNNGRSLLQVLLTGEVALWDRFNKPEAEDLHQRVVAAHKLGPLVAEEIRGYIENRLRKAGWDRDPKLDKDCFPLIYEYTRGVPRLINEFCDRLLRTASSRKQHVLETQDITCVMDELKQQSSTEKYSESSLAKLEKNENNIDKLMMHDEANMTTLCRVFSVSGQRLLLTAVSMGKNLVPTALDPALTKVGATLTRYVDE